MEEEGFKIVHRKRHSRAVIKKPNALNRLSIVEDNISVSGDDLLSLQTSINIIRNFGFELQQSEFFKAFQDVLITHGFISSMKEIPNETTSAIQEIVCYGIGKFAESKSSRYQFAFLELLCDILQVLKSNCYLYDPCFSICEKKIISKMGYNLITTNEEGKRCTEKVTLYYMPHCGKPLYNNLLWINWHPDRLKNTLILGNSFKLMHDSMPERIMKQQLPCVNKIMPVVREYPIQNSFVHKDIFNDTSLHIFSSTLLDKCGLDIQEQFWTNTEELDYSDDVEIITAITQIHI